MNNSGDEQSSRHSTDVWVTSKVMGELSDLGAGEVHEQTTGIPELRNWERTVQGLTGALRDGYLHSSHPSPYSMTDKKRRNLLKKLARSPKKGLRQRVGHVLEMLKRWPFQREVMGALCGLCVVLVSAKILLFFLSDPSSPRIGQETHKVAFSLSEDPVQGTGPVNGPVQPPADSYGLPLGDMVGYGGLSPRVQEPALNHQHPNAESRENPPEMQMLFGLGPSVQESTPMDTRLQQSPSITTWSMNDDSLGRRSEASALPAPSSAVSGENRGLDYYRSTDSSPARGGSIMSLEAGLSDSSVNETMGRFGSVASPRYAAPDRFDRQSDLPYESLAAVEEADQAGKVPFFKEALRDSSIASDELTSEFATPASNPFGNRRLEEESILRQRELSTMYDRSGGMAGGASPGAGGYGGVPVSSSSGTEDRSDVGLPAVGRPLTREKWAKDQDQNWSVRMDSSPMAVAQSTISTPYPTAAKPGMASNESKQNSAPNFMLDPAGKSFFDSDGDALASATTGATAEIIALQMDFKNAESELGESLTLAKKLESDSPESLPPANEMAPYPEVDTIENAFSSFGMNVSDASFHLAYASLLHGQRPDPAQIRSEEFINAMDYFDPAPDFNETLAIHSDRALHPFEVGREILRIGVQTASEGWDNSVPMNLTVLLDTSGSMERPDRRAIVESILQSITQSLQEKDRLSVVGFARQPTLWLDNAIGGNPQEILNTIDGIRPDGGTNIDLALDSAYTQGLRNFIPGGRNRLLLLTDGAANLGEVNPSTLKNRVEDGRRAGLALDAFGIGWDGHDDTLLEEITRHSDGTYGFLDDPESAGEYFEQRWLGALQVAAENVKVQVEFNPDRVERYRQVGYQKLRLTQEEFLDNSVDAGEIAQADDGQALYILSVKPDSQGPLGWVRVRYRNPSSGQYEMKSRTLVASTQAPQLENASPAMKLAFSTAAFAEKLASNPYAADVDLAYLEQRAQEAHDAFPRSRNPYIFREMVRLARRLGL